MVLDAKNGLAQQHPTLRWVPDAVTPTEIRELMEQLLG